jgi:plasmid stabilization system protein ParE
VICVFRPVARDDVICQFRYYLSELARDAAFRFLDAVGEAREQIRAMPAAGAPKQFRNPVLAGLRSWPVRGFEDIRIYYLVDSGVIRAIRVLRGSRDISRIPESESASAES